MNEIENLRRKLADAERERDVFARALRSAVVSPTLREMHVVAAKEDLAREREREAQA